MSGIAPVSDVPVIAFGSPAGPSRHRMSAVAGWFRWRTTPDRIRGIAAVTMIVAVLLGLITAVAFTSIAAGLRLIGQQSEPEVLATTDLYFRLNDMDAQVANVLLVGGQRGLGIDRQQAQAIYEQDRRQADQDLLHAAVVARSEPSVRALLDDLGRYEALASEAMYLDGRGPDQPGRPPAAALVLYRQATDLLRSGILPAAHALTDQNTAALDGTYQAKRSTARYDALWVALAGKTPVGFALVQMLADDLPHLEELDVDPSHGRRGVGTALVRAVCKWAAGSGYTMLTLSTFRAVPWNFPFYARLGFEEIPRETLRSELLAVVSEEADRGLDPDTRVVMGYRCVPPAIREQPRLSVE